uniref:Cyclic AMP-dependent transcription factor ATF-7 n=1 Tax=Tetraodon nigroviridis TaxID=99883 RepID=H3C3R7_TETNG
FARFANDMNDKQDRPYVCGAPGCSQHFQTEEHLLIHRHKHEMSLKFSSIKTDAAFTDQTPTPTRFLQNCEEVGLFKEIEEEFLQEQEEEKNKEHAHPQPQLHHPHTLPLQHPQSHGSMMGPSCSHNTQHALSSSLARLVVTQTSSALTHTGPVPGSLSSLLHMQNRHRQPLPASLPGTLPDPAMQGASAQHMVIEKQMAWVMGKPGPPLGSPASHTHAQSLHAEPQWKNPTVCLHHPGMVINNPVTSAGHAMDTMALRHSAPLLQPQHRPPQQHSQFPSPNFYQQQVHTPPQQQLGGTHGHQLHQSIGLPHAQVRRSSPTQLRQGSPPAPPQETPTMQRNKWELQQRRSAGGVGRRRRIVEQDPDERRQKFLERNRAAATRCRQKRKLWVSSLERKAEELTHTNLQLQNEVTALRTEVGQLKQILLTHKDCPVTARQRETQVYPTAGQSPGGSPTRVGAGSRLHAIQHNSISTSST